MPSFLLTTAKLEMSVRNYACPYKMQNLKRGIFLLTYVVLKVQGGSRMSSDGVQFDQIIVRTLRIRKDRPEQTV